MKLSTALCAVVLMVGVAPSSAQMPDLTKVQIEATKISDRFYRLEGQGGTIGVLIGPDGVFMVDTQFAALGERISAAIRALTPEPIRFVVNTHVHGDHTGGNEYFAKAGAAIIARDELRTQLERPTPLPNGQPGTPAVPAALPRLTYRDRLTLHMNGEAIQVIGVPRAHTGGDSMVYFPTANVIMTGDFYRSIQYPLIDRTNGGSLQGLLDGLAAVIDLARPDTRIIPGHGPAVDRAAVSAHRDLVVLLRDRVRKLVADGRSEQEVVAANLTKDLDARIQQPGTTGERFVRQLFVELSASK